jgi:hypothetical protein
MAKVQRPEKHKKNSRSEVEEFKEFLGPVATRYSDAQLIQLRSDMHAAARLLLDLYLLQKESGRKGQKAFDNHEAET